MSLVRFAPLSGVSDGLFPDCCGCHSPPLLLLPPCGTRRARQQPWRDRSVEEYDVVRASALVQRVLLPIIGKGRAVRGWCGVLFLCRESGVPRDSLLACPPVP